MRAIPMLIFGLACVVALASALPLQSAANDILLIPNASSSTPAAALLFFPGAGLAADQYMPLLLQLQQSTVSASLWVAIAGTSFSSDSDVGRLLSDLQDQKFPGGLLFAGGHSSELDQLQRCIVANTSSCSQIHAAVLLGFPLLRQFRSSFPLPVMTIAGTLDGVSRVTRTGAESLFHALSANAPSICKLRSSSTPNILCPVIAIDGISHMSFASGSPSSLIHQLDLKPDVAEGDAHVQIAKFIAAFLATAASPSSSPAIQILESGVAASEVLMGPFIDAMQAEGSPWLGTWCNSDFPTNSACNYPKYPDASLPPGPKPSPNPPPPSDCICGSPFVRSFAQSIMSNFSSSSHPSAVIAAADAFHDVSDVHPFHLPHIWNSCKLSDASCTLNVTSVTMPILETADNFDGTRAPISALEFRTKLKSRQATWEAVGLPDPDLSTSDGSLAICRAINELSISLALKSAPSSALQRYSKYGEQLVAVDDVKSGIGPEGPKWIQDELKYTRITRPDGTSVMSVQSWTFDTPNVNHGDVPYYVTAGYHYCKILSPARSMEWVMVDSLRLHGGLGSANV